MKPQLIFCLALAATSPFLLGAEGLSTPSIPELGQLGSYTISLSLALFWLRSEQSARLEDAKARIEEAKRNSEALQQIIARLMHNKEGAE